jgi:hypothetical protein
VSSGSECLTRERVRAVKHLMTAVRNSKGEVVYAYPYIPGTETQWEGWNFSVQSPAGAVSEYANYKVAHQFQSYLGDEKPRSKVDPLKFNFDRDPPTLLVPAEFSMQLRTICVHLRCMLERCSCGTAWPMRVLWRRPR